MEDIAVSNSADVDIDDMVKHLGVSAREMTSFDHIGGTFNRFRLIHDVCYLAQLCAHKVFGCGLRP